MHETVTALLESYGYVFLFVVVGTESLGIPVPGEIALVTAAAYAALGHLDIYLVIITAACAAIVGDTGGYWIGYSGGLALVRRWGRRLHVDESHIDRAHRFFERHGGKTVFIGRFVAILRTWAAVLAGVARMPYRSFLVFNATGGILWAALFGTLGYVFGRNLPELEHLVGQASLLATLFLALFIALALILHWFRTNSSAIAEATAKTSQRILHTPMMEKYGHRHPRLWKFIAARFARGEYLGLHLTIGIVVSLAALWIFGAIAEDVIHHDPLTQMDLLILHWFRSHATPSGDAIMSAISLVGSPAAAVLLAVVGAAILWMRRRWLVLGGWIAAFAGGGLIDAALKILIHRPRPIGAMEFLKRFSYSFPSGHAMGSVIGYGMLAYILITFWATRGRARVLIIVAALLLVLLIGLSRIYLGVHYFSDVIGGFAAGSVWLVVCISGVEIARRQPRSSGD
ncbi:MAG: bifunctional DedA family/phosphatase PAP2 family protein [Gemmatimonadaceae bacterium]